MVLCSMCLEEKSGCEHRETGGDNLNHGVSFYSGNGGRFNFLLAGALTGYQTWKSNGQDRGWGVGGGGFEITALKVRL